MRSLIMAKVATQETAGAASKKMDENTSKDLHQNSKAYEINHDLFDEANIIKLQLTTVLERLEKMNEHRSNVSPSVFAKVQQDYTDQKRSIQKSFEIKRKEISKELLNLYTARQEKEAEVAKQEQILEEAKFRHFLSEYDDKTFGKVEQEQLEKIDSVKQVLGVINDTINSYENLVGGPIPEDPTMHKDISMEPPENKAVEVKTAKVEEPKISEPKIETPPTAIKITETREEESVSISKENLDQLDDELDLFLEESSNDYFQPEQKNIAKMDTPSQTMPEVEKNQNDDLEDSLSSILRSIPMDEEDASRDVAQAETTPKSDATKISVPYAAASEAKFILLEGDLDDAEIILGENTSIGRSPSNDIVLREAKVSRQHAAINFMNGQYVLVDLKSSNGVFVNAKRIEEHVLEDSDIVQVGSYQFKFSNE